MKYKLIITYLLFVCLLSSCSSSKLDNSFFTKQNHYYLNKKSNFILKTDKKIVFPNYNNKSKNFTILYKIKGEKISFDVIHIIDTISYFKNFSNNNSKYKNIKKIEGNIQDYIKDDYKFNNYSYQFKEKDYNETIIYAKKSVISLKLESNGLINTEFVNNTILDADKFVKNNAYFFYDNYFEFNEFLMNEVFLQYNDLKDLTLEKNLNEITQLINNYNKQGNYKASNSLINNFYKNKALIWKSDYKVSDFEIKNIEKFCKSLDNIDIVLINDHHLFESSRYSTAILLNELKKQGFNYFAAESFTIVDNDLNFDIKENDMDGFYLRQPTYGLLTHYALLNNFILCGYDSSSNICDDKYFTNQQCRDSIQARNIAKIFENNKNAKIVVFGGHSHINKTKNKNFTPMGFYLQKELPQKKIFSINQVSLISNLGIENALQKIIADSLKLKEPMIIKSEKHFEKINDGTYDAYLIHPNNNPYEYWYYSKNKINTEKIEIRPPKEAFFIEIIPTSLLKKNISVFKMKVTDLYKNYIYLPKSNYIINYYNSNNSLIYDIHINKL